MRTDDIRKLIKIIEESDLAEIEVTRWWGWGRVRVTKVSPNQISVMSPAMPGNGSGAAPTGMSQPVPNAANAGTWAPAEPGAAAMPAPGQPAPPDARYTSIRSPMVGTFYRTPAADAEPYVEIGQYVEVGQTVCIIEAMKLMNPIESDVRGRIVAVKVEHKHPVEYGQVLFLVDPS